MLFWRKNTNYNIDYFDFSFKMWRKKLCRTVFYVILSLQLISLVERQIFDFLGYMWLPMLANFCNTIIAILAIFGNYQYHTTYLFIYIVWTLCWIGWNTFIGKSIVMIETSIRIHILIIKYVEFWNTSFWIFFSMLLPRAWKLGTKYGSIQFRNPIL